MLGLARYAVRTDQERKDMSVIWARKSQEYRGTLTSPGGKPHRGRSVEKPDLFRRMGR